MRELRRYDVLHFEDGVAQRTRVAGSAHGFEQRILAGVIQRQRRSIVASALKESQPGGCNERDAGSVQPTLKAIQRRREQPLRHFLRAVHCDLRRAMTQGRIGEARQERNPIGRKID